MILYVSILFVVWSSIFCYVISTLLVVFCYVVLNYIGEKSRCDTSVHFRTEILAHIDKLYKGI